MEDEVKKQILTFATQEVIRILINAHKLCEENEPFIDATYTIKDKNYVLKFGHEDEFLILKTENDIN